MHGIRPSHWLIALAALAVVLALGWLVTTHIADVATDAATRAVESHEDGHP
jgi:hypothetical protein